MPFTHEQDAVVTRSANLQENEILKVLAFAGAGKTTTLVGVAEARSRQRGAYMAFNKSIAEEAQRKFAKTRCKAATMHSLAFGAVRDVIGAPSRITAGEIRKSGVLDLYQFPYVKGWGPYRQAAAVLRTMAAFANSADQEVDVTHAREALVESTGDPDTMHDAGRRKKATEVIEAFSIPLMKAAEEVWCQNMEAGRMNHDMYLKMLDLDAGLREDAFHGFRYLMIDEAQDSNPVQVSILAKTGLPLIAVGDPYQQIYSWRGAENALARMKGEELYLTQSFRFGEDIAAIGRDILEKRPDGGPTQRLTGLGDGNISKHKGAAAAIICRTNVGMLDEAVRLIAKGFEVHVDKIETLIEEVNSAQALYDGRMEDIRSPDIKQFSHFGEMELAAEAGDPGMNKLVKLVVTRRTEEVGDLAKAHCQDASKAKVLICTGHRSKGLEFPAVQFGSDWQNVDTLQKRVTKAAQQSPKAETLAIEEYNLLYVAATRAMLRLRGHEKLLSPERDPIVDQRSEHEPA